MEKFKVNIHFRDAETGTTNDQSQEEKEATQENINVSVKQVADLRPIMESLTDDDTISVSIPITDTDNPEKKACLTLENVKRSDILRYGAMLNAAISALNPPASTSDAATPIKDDVAATGAVIPDGDGNAKELDEQQ